MIVFKDLAFGWSTTLQADSVQLHRVMEALANPWARFLPGANSSLGLIPATRHFRLNEVLLPIVNVEQADPQMLGGRQTFLIAAKVCCGLAPRLLTLGLACWRLAAAIRHAFLNTRGLAQLYDRLNNDIVDTQADEPKVKLARIQPPSAVSGECSIINWSDVGIDDCTARHLVAQVFGPHAHRSEFNLTHDRSTQNRTEELPSARRKALETCFRRLRKADDPTEICDRLITIVQGLLRP